MSPRAAWRLKSLGFTEVYDYVAGKADWAASGLPMEGKLASFPSIGDAARRDVPTCGLEERVGDVRERVRAAGWDTCVVVNSERVVLGLLRGKELESGLEATVEEVMRPGPTTSRPNTSLEEMTGRIRRAGAPSVLVTTSDGRLVGLLLREDAEWAVDEASGAELREG